MIDISIPMICENLRFYNKLILLTKTKPYLFKEKFFISSVYGNFPWSYWGGEVNNTKKYIGVQEIENFSNQNGTPIIFDISNLNLTPFDLLDRKLDLTLTEFDNGANFISTNNMDVIDFIQQNYPNYRIIFSENGHFINKYNADIINTILDNPNIYEMILSENIVSKEILEKIEKKNKVRLKICNKCSLKCNKYNICRQQENNLIYNFSEKSIYSGCADCFKFDDFTKLSYEIASYQSLGFNKFMIDTPPSNFSLSLFDLFLLTSLGKKDNYEIIKEVLFND